MEKYKQSRGRPGQRTKVDLCLQYADEKLVFNLANRSFLVALGCSRGENRCCIEIEKNRTRA